MSRPFLGAGNILDLQNNGYKNTAFAVSELVDNSIQAGATQVEIILISDIATNQRGERNSRERQWHGNES